MLLMMCGLGIAYNSTSVLIHPICESLEFDRGPFNITRSIILGMTALTMPFYGKMVPVIGYRRVFLIGILGIFVATFGYSMCGTLSQFYLCSVVHGFFYNALHFISVGLLMNALFGIRQGVPVAITAAGSGFGAAIMSPIVADFAARFGWRAGYRLAACVALFIAVPVIFFLIKEPSGAARQDVEKNEKENTKAQTSVFSDRNVYYLSLITFIVGTMSVVLSGLLAAMLSDIGYSSRFAALASSAMFILLIVNKLMLGFLYDRLSMNIANLFFIVGTIITPVMGLFLHKIPALVIFLVGASIVCSGVSVVVSVLSKRYFLNNYQKVFSIASTACSVGTAVGMPIAGYIFDICGNYTMLWYIFAAMALCMAGAIILLERRREKGNV